MGVQSHLKAVVLRETWLLHKNKDGWGGGVACRDHRSVWSRGCTVSIKTVRHVTLTIRSALSSSMAMAPGGARVGLQNHKT